MARSKRSVNGLRIGAPCNSLKRLRKAGLVDREWSENERYGRYVYTRGKSPKSILAAPEHLRARFAVDHLTACRRHWDTCLHEAAHTVRAVCFGYDIDEVYVHDEPVMIGGGSTYDFSNAFDRGTLPEALRKSHDLVSVAGGVATLIWGIDASPSRGYPSHQFFSNQYGDFRRVVRRSTEARNGQRVSTMDIQHAKHIWRERTGELLEFARTHPEFELQVKAVAKELSLTGKLSNVEVKLIMDEVK